MPQNFEIKFDFDSIPQRVTGVYLALGLIWVVASEKLLPGAAFAISLGNRSAFVIVTGVALYLMLAQWRRRINKLQTELRRAIERATAYFESTQWGIFSIDRQGLILRSNPKAREMFGYREDELVGQAIEMLMPERIRSRHERHREDYFAAPRNRPMGVGMDLVGRRKDGIEFPIEVSLHLIKTDDTDFVSAFVSDITDRLKMEREARRGETLAALGAVAAGVAHELNNPLAVALSRIELILQTGVKELSPQMREDLEVVHRNAQRASRIASELLNAARQRRIERRPVDLIHLVDETMLLFREQLRRDGIAVTVALPDALPPILGDQSALGQVLINLLSNARDAIVKNNDEIRITARNAPERPGFVELRIEDTGQGIAPEAKARIFDVFYTTKANGAGLGLWLCRRIVLEHQGTIEVESEPGCATTFIITLPAANESIDATGGRDDVGATGDLPVSGNK